MKKKIKFLIFLIFPLILICILLTFFFFQYNESVKKKEITKLIVKYYNEKQYETARKFAEELLIKYYSDKELLDILDKINDAEKNNINRPIIVSSNVDLSELKNISRLLDILKARVDKLSENNGQPKIIERERTIIEKNGKQRIYDEYEVAKLINDGKKYYNERQFAESLNVFKEVLKLDENNIDAYVYLGASLFELNPDNDKTLEEASRNCKKALEFDKSNELAHFTLGRIYENRKMDKDALLELNETLRINPNNYLAYYNLGRIYFNSRDFYEAEKKFSNLIEIKKDFAEAYFFLALSEIELKKSNEAKINLNKCLSFDSKFYKSYLKLAEISISEKNYKDAVHNYDKALSLDKNYQYYYSAGECLEKINDTNTAVGYFQNSLNINPLKSDKDKSIAFNCFEKMISIEKGKSNFNQALFYCQRGIEALKEKGTTFYLTSADLKIKIKKPNDAINDYLKAIDLKISNSNEVYCRIGETYEELKDTKKAVNAYKKSIELYKDYPDVYYRLGKLYYLQNNFKESKEYFVKVLEKKSDYPKRDEIENILTEIKNKEVR